MSLGQVRRILSGQLRSSSLWAGKTSRSMATSGPMVNVSVDDKSGVAVLEMNRPPTNSLSYEMLTEMNTALDELENNKKCRGVILSSSSKSVFSAGFDIQEVYKPTAERLAAFWDSFQDMWIKLYGSRMITIAAINGHAPAGGCLQALSCDYRVMAEGKIGIGFNETLLGIATPFWFGDVMTNVIGKRETEKALQLGHLFHPQQALEVGLVDIVVPQDNVMESAKGEMAKWLKIPDHARMLTKESLRRPTLQKMMSRKEEDSKHLVKFIMHDSVQKPLQKYVEMMTKQKGKKA